LLLVIPFSDLTLLVGRHEGRLACKKFSNYYQRLLFWTTTPQGIQVSIFDACLKPG